MDTIGHWINGREVIQGATFASVNPATGATIAQVSSADEAIVDQAVQSARQAAPTWEAAGVKARRDVLNTLADLIAANAEDIAQRDTLDCGMPISLSRAGVNGLVDSVRMFAGMTGVIRGTSTPLEDGRIAFTLRQPYGVVGGITPWNYPFNVAIHKVVPALAAGNAIVLKPADLTPLTAMDLARLCTEAGVPDGVFNLVQGTGPEAGAALARNPGVGIVSFTGSTATGKVIQQLAAEGMTRPVALELGGKDPAVILDDADLDAAVACVRRSVFNHAGQTCTAETRVLAHRSVADEVIERLHERIRGLNVGDPTDPATDVGPLISPQQLARVDRYVQQAKDEGAQVVIGGGRLDDGDLANGNFYRPTLFSGVTADHTIFHEEVFGPVMTVTTFDDDDEALRLANLPQYGLQASVWTRDLERALRFSAGIDAGTVQVNGMHVPSGGIGGTPWKASGHHPENGLEGVMNLTRSKTVILQPAPRH